jgi:hypothetical protein
MADDEKKSERKPRKEALYDHKDSRKMRDDKAPKPAASKDQDAKGGDGGNKEMPRDHAEMLKRHENQRREMHNNQRTEHRAIDAEPGDDMPHKKMAAHRRHRVQMDEMHGQHEKEMMEKMGAMQGGGVAQAEPDAAAPAQAAA